MDSMLSTTALAKTKQLEAAQLFDQLQQAGYLYRQSTKGKSRWVLTYLGERFGGQYKDHPTYGKYIAWPRTLFIDHAWQDHPLMTATALGDHFSLAAKKINLLLKELGWLAKTDSGWRVTDHGKRAGGQQKKHDDNDYALWHPSIQRHPRLVQTVREFTGQESAKLATDHSISEFRKKFEAKHRTLDGHYVRTEGELILDNWLYMAGVTHAYARQLPIEQEEWCDFYLPQANLYLQYWPFNCSQPSPERDALLSLYQSNDLDLIELFADEIEQLDDLLPKRLRQYGIKAY